MTERVAARGAVGLEGGVEPAVHRRRGQRGNEALEGEESEEDRADRQEYAEEVRRGVFGPNSGPGPRLKKRRMWSPAHKTPRL